MTTTVIVSENRTMADALELPFRGRLLGAYAACDDLRPVVVLGLDRGPRNPTKDRSLPDVGERVGHRTLKQLLCLSLQCFSRRKKIVKLLKGCEETFDLFFPHQRLGTIPRFFALSNR